MINLTDLLAATGGQTTGSIGAVAWSDFCHDSRLAEPGQLFVALRTPTGDGHEHIADAVARGCTGVLCQYAGSEPPAVTTILVPDTGDALRAWSAYILRRYKPLVVAITGSNGKTTAKELAAEMLEQAYPGQIFRTHASYNDRLGIPLALGRLNSEHRIAVVEVGTDAHGETAELAGLLQPTIAAITVINDAHIGAFGSSEAIAEEKMALIRQLPATGLAILNGDDPLQMGYLDRLQARTFVHASEVTAALRLEDHSPFAPAPHSLSLTVDEAQLSCLREGLAENHFQGLRASPAPSEIPTPAPCQTNLLGAHQNPAIRTAIAIALVLGVRIDEIVSVLAAFQPLPGRLRSLPGPSGSILLDDTYGANPTATRAALRLFAMYDSPRIAILGEHTGLGLTAETLLVGLGPDIAACLDHLITVGPQASIMAQAAADAGLAAKRLHHADTPVAAAEIARTLLQHGGVCLVKGSREARLERAVAALMAQPERATDLLARQSPGWAAVRLRNTLRPTWVEINTVALTDNIAAVRERLQPGVRLIAVLKADAYGHGAPMVARVAMQNGASMLAVACLPEAQALRRAGIHAPILILGYTPPWQARMALEMDLHLTVYDVEAAQAFDQAAQALGRRLPVHVKVDSGMGRLGLFPEDVIPFLRTLAELPALNVTGLFTHMANADQPDHPHTGMQLGRFSELVDEITAAGLRPPLIHAANTAAMLTRPDAHYDAVRVGIGLYGLNPSSDLPLPLPFRPVLAWKTTIAQVKRMPAGSTVGYGLSYRTEGDETLAVIPVGYADGFRRAPRAGGHVLVRGHKAPLVGRISMDQATIDVSAIPGVRPGDEVILIGRQGDHSIRADDIANELGTINYEVISGILARVPRLPE
ncbi:MAG: alanine racemase [Caldilineales bacterium]|nr:alanine racemase [Caldilineales bacterium]